MSKLWERVVHHKRGHCVVLVLISHFASATFHGPSGGTSVGVSVGISVGVSVGGTGVAVSVGIGV
jgi:hypothetical protein